jgi:hypothetical protein
MPSYSITVAAVLTEVDCANVIVTEAPETVEAGANQISVVEPLLLVACVALVHPVTPLCVILDTVLFPVFLVEIIATRVFPF